MASTLTALNDEFRILARGTTARRALRRWAVTHPVLEGLDDLQAVLDLRSRRPETAQQVLSALAALSPGDELATRTLLHALLPGLVRLARTSGHDDPDAIEAMLSLAWERIRTYPADRHGGVAANVLLDVRKWYRRDRSIDAPRSTPLPASAEAAVRSAEDEALDLVSLGEVAAACRRGVISEFAFRLIVQTRFVGRSLAEIAGQEHVDAHRLAQRRYVAERRLLSELPLAG